MDYQFYPKPINPFQDDGLSKEDRAMINGMRETAYICGKELTEDEEIFFCKECGNKIMDENNKRKKELENQLNALVQNIIEAESEE